MVDTGMAPRALLALAALAGVARGELGAPCMKSNAADSSTQQCMPFCKADKSHQGHCSMCKCKACKPCGGAVAMAPSPPPVPKSPKPVKEPVAACRRSLVERLNANL